MKIPVLIIALCSVFLSVNGKPMSHKRNKDRMNKANIKFEVRTKINAPAKDVWKIVGKEFDKISSWTDFVEHSQSVDSEEVTKTPYTPDNSAPVPARKTKVINKGRTSELIEVITMYSDENRSLKFYGVGLPKFISFASDVQSVVTIGENECEIVFEVELRVKGIFKLLKNKMKNHFYESMTFLQNDLKLFVESGKAL